jgi:hypothetical protein
VTFRCPKCGQLKSFAQATYHVAAEDAADPRGRFAGDRIYSSIVTRSNGRGV